MAIGVLSVAESDGIGEGSWSVVVSETSFTSRFDVD